MEIVQTLEEANAIRDEMWKARQSQNFARLEELRMHLVRSGFLVIDKPSGLMNVAGPYWRPVAKDAGMFSMASHPPDVTVTESSNE